MKSTKDFQRIQLWLGIAGLLEQKPNPDMALKLCVLIFNLTEGTESYNPLYILEVWETLKD